MIRITLNAQSDPQIHLFNQSTILIGTESGHADLILPDPDIQPVHLKIVEQNGCFILINYVNDPFVSLNGHPFGKKLLNSGDILVVHQTTLLFENLDSSSPNAKNDRVKEEALISSVENKIQKQEETNPQSEDLTSFSLPFEQDLEVLGEEELNGISLENYLKKIDSASETPQPSPLESIKEQNVGHKKTASLKDDYLRELEDDHQEGKDPFRDLKEPSHLYQAWKWILVFIFSLLAVSGMIGTILYFSVSDKTEAQEIKAAQGVADLTMALTHAQLNYLQPHNHNWSDVDFLKTNLQAILPHTSSYASQIDAQGQFNCCPYSLRIYTNSDLSHFLLIAQPAPSLLNWLIPQSLIVVDSHLMELRILKDVKSLNRLLANSDPLDGASGKEITSLIKQGRLIRLSNLANDSGNLDFAPPKNLAWIRSGAENFIYNAPRYYRLGYHIIQKAITLSTSKGSSQEVTDLKQDINNLSWLNDFTLYSDDGKKSAILTRQAIMMFAPSEKLLFGYLLFNVQGKIHQVHLLNEDEEGKELITQTIQEGDIVAFHSSHEMNSKEESGKKNVEDPIDVNHPIYIQLRTLMIMRDNELKPLMAALSNLMIQELQLPRSQFQFEFQNLSHTYLMANAKHKQTIKEALDTLYHQYEDIPVQQFLAFITALNLEELIQHEEKSLLTVDENAQHNLEGLLLSIENSQSLVELDNFIHIANNSLNFDSMQDPQELMKYQNLLRNQVLEELKKYLLSQEKHFLVKSDDREILLHILNQERLIKPEEKDFFLKEFEESLVLQRPSEQIKEKEQN